MKRNIAVCLSLVMLLCGSAVVYAAKKEVKLTTYYPSANADYKKVDAQEMKASQRLNVPVSAVNGTNGTIWVV